MEFGDKIKNLREKSNMSREELADKLRIKYQTLAKYETNDREPDFKTLSQIALVLETSIDYLLGNVEKNFTKKTQQNDLSDEEVEHLKKYRVLDERGKQNVDETLEREYKYVINQENQMEVG